jgi:hypothetical protein
MNNLVPNPLQVTLVPLAGEASTVPAADEAEAPAQPNPQL